MEKENVKEKIRKLLAHEQSARTIGNVAEADAYASHVKLLMRRHKITKKSLEPAKPKCNAPVDGRWVCSCGFDMVLKIDAGAANDAMLNAFLSPHTGAGHRLVKQ